MSYEELSIDKTPQNRIATACAITAIASMLLCVGYQNCGRTRVDDCVGGMGLLSPGDYQATWRIVNNHDREVVAEYRSEERARRACDTGIHK